MQLFGALLSETILFPVPHRHFTFGMPKMLRPYFRYNRDLLKDLCRIAHECLLEYLRTTLDLPDGLPGIVMAIHTFGEYLDFQRDKRAAEEAAAADQAVEVIDVSEHQPRRIPSAKWRELIKKVWEADPLLCPKCLEKMRIVALIDDREVIERILRHLGLWEQGVRVAPARAPPEICATTIRNARRRQLHFRMA